MFINFYLLNSILAPVLRLNLVSNELFIARVSAVSLVYRKYLEGMYIEKMIMLDGNGWKQIFVNIFGPYTLRYMHRKSMFSIMKESNGDEKTLIN